ncbi:MAG: tetratricopeptide repeat protein [Candidatus Moranbacteria bacterium]|nr:tetratricopeptide repeat protein [Candidatus Moranbacteria bacterium]
MLYLIVPPIIIVLAIIGLLWYLSRKANDPLVQERVHEQEARANKHFLGLREWSLRFLEKFAQRSKNRSLRMHNALHNWLQSIRESRKKVAEEKQLVGEEQYEESEEDKIEFFETVTPNQREEMIVDPILEEVQQKNSFAIPFMRRHKRDGQDDAPAPVEKVRIVAAKVATDITEREERPMVSAKVVVPDTRKKSSKGGSSEEDMIGRIATNPKDFEAYEALGDFYMESGNIKDAKECYRQVLKLSPVQRMVKIKIRRLEKLLSQKGN